MQKHEHFDELCALAVIGELSREEMTELTLHVRNCAACQLNYSELTELVSDQLSLAGGHSDGSNHPLPQDSRTATLRRVSQEGLFITPEAIRGPVSFRQRVLGFVDEVRWQLFARKAQLAFSAGLVLAAISVGWIVKYDHQKQQEVESLRIKVEASHRTAGQLAEDLTTSQRERSLGKADVEHLQEELSQANRRLQTLEAVRVQNQSAIDSLKTMVDGLTSENHALEQQANSKQRELAAAQSELEQMHTAAQRLDADLIAARYQVNEVTNRLKSQQTALDHERELLAAGRDIRDLIGARNLHIIDVHDMDDHGESRPFGRIFLTEGKRLIFYAYDLNAASAKSAAFQAWGQRAEGNQSAVSLGILYLDDQKQSRWALKVEDPQLLSAIDSVFVTMEPHGGAEKPTGKKLMYAFLRNPINHP